MVDLGCGTGLLSTQLLRRFPSAALLGIDLAPGMVEHCRQSFAKNSSVRFITGDVEDRGMLVPEVGLVASSCVAQWFINPSATIQMWARALAPGGVLALACLVEGSFCELREAYSEALQRDFQGLRLPSPEAVPSLLGAGGLRVITSAQEPVTAYYSGPREALRSFQQIGAVFHGQPNYEQLGPGAVRRLLSCYERHANGLGLVPVTHCVQYLIAERTE
jgi:malonyl-CoA O-methyltransferase